MTRRDVTRRAMGLVAFVIALAWLALSAPVASAMAQDGVNGPTVIELFTSQSCSSCPPAEALLGELAARPDLVALEFHVDYWNDLVAGTAGQWRDVHSDPAYTARQRAYAARLATDGSGGVYTPQMVIDGQAQAVGSDARAVGQAIATARRSPHPGLAVTTTGTGGLIIKAASAPAPIEGPAELWLVRYRDHEETRVRGGENRGRLAVNHHIVTGMTRLAPWSGGADAVTTETIALADGEGCALVVQRTTLGPVLAAAPCPMLSARAP